MKKNITINLQGRLYAIDEDAYELLKCYTDSLRNYFARREGGEEIADDIEARIVELFDEQKRDGAETVTIEQMESIIHRIGNPGEMDASPSEPSDDEEAPEPKPESPSSEEKAKASAWSKRLYRDPSDRKLMGVLSGIAACIGGDVLLYRLAFVLSVLFSMFVLHFNSLWAFLVILYIILALLMPVADTPEERLRMKGKKVNPQNLAEEISRSGHAKAAEMPTGCVGSFFFMLVTFGRWCVYFIGFMLVLALLCAIGAIVACLTLASEEYAQYLGLNIWEAFPDSHGTIILGSIAGIALLLIPAYCIIHSLFVSLKKLKPMGVHLRLSFLLVWIAAFIMTVCTGTRIVRYHEKWRSMNEMRRRLSNTHDGIYYQYHEWDFLSDRGWRVTLAENCNDRYTAVGQYYTGDGNARYIDCWDEAHRQRFTIQRVEHLMPGTYRLTACVRAEAQGACIFVRYGNKKPTDCYEIPADGNTGGNIWEEAVAKRDSMLRKGEVSDSLELQQLTNIAVANGGKGFGWNRMTLPDIKITKPVAVYYGVTTDPEVTGRTWLGRWLSACDFTLQRIDNKK